ncbi:MAG: tetratricopeptide repeat protein, partial [Alphaproteobacteria bacterium]
SEAAWWFTKSAQTGHLRAQYGLGVIYAEGVAVPKDYIEAARWYSSAADQGHAQAQYELAVLLTNGEGVAQDLVSAMKWLQLAGEAGVEAAVAARELLAGEMPPRALADADQLARTWSARKEQAKALGR